LRNGSNLDADFLGLDLGELKFWGIVLQHPVGVADVFFQFGERLALAEDSRDLPQSSNIPALVLPILKRELSHHGLYCSDSLLDHIHSLARLPTS
jgi:hypothetical protein